MFHVLRGFASTLYPNYPAVFQSLCPLDVAVERLRRRVVQGNAITALFLLFAPSDIALGYVKPQNVCLQRVGRSFNNTFKPIFRGVFEKQGDGVSLVGTFTTSRFAKIFTTFWFGFLTIWTLLSLLALPMALQRPNAVVFPAFGVGIFVIGYWFLRLCWSISRRDIDFLSSIIRDALKGNEQ